MKLLDQLRSQNFPWGEIDLNAPVALGPEWFNNQRELEAILKPEMVVLELGAFYGRSTIFFAERCKYVYTVDTWLGSRGEHDNDAFRCLQFYDQFVRNVWQYRKKIYPLRMWSHLSPQLLLEAGIVPDLVYIDAGHTYDDVTADLLACDTFPKSTIITGDDFGHGHDDHGVERAVLSFVDAYGYGLNVSRNWFYQIER